MNISIEILFAYSKGRDTSMPSNIPNGRENSVLERRTLRYLTPGTSIVLANSKSVPRCPKLLEYQTVTELRPFEYGFPPPKFPLDPIESFMSG